jgi:tight adherence protein B
MAFALQMITLGLVFGATAILVTQAAPVIWDNLYSWRVRGVEAQRLKLREVFVDMDPQKLFIINIVAPTTLSVVGLIVTRSIVGCLIGMGVGLVIPALIVKNMILSRKSKFSAQITDGLMILSSCLKGGLSLLQSIEALVEELPPPISQEFGLILRENKMGISLEESF